MMSTSYIFRYLQYFLKICYYVIANQRVLRAHFMFGRNDAVLNRIFNLFKYGFSIQNSII